MKILKTIGIFSTALLFSACTSTVGNNTLNDKGQLIGDTLDWPKIEDATQEFGIYPNTEDLSKVRAGLTKRELYGMFDKPHFSEINGASEWNYIFKFKNEDGSVKTCQYKIFFDDDDVAREFYWLPKDCYQ